jgi:antitoxin component YwqK of YwqJK toxin-antitoxin module
MKRILIFVAFFYSLASFAQKVKYYDYRWKEIATAETARFFSVIEKTDTGWHKYDYFIQEKRLQMDGTYEDSAEKIPVGPFRYYHANGQLLSAGRYVHGKKDGLWVSYHYNGMISDSTSYNNGHKIGASYRWHENGYPSDSSVWNDDGSGVSVGWFNNGNPSHAGRYGPRAKQEGVWLFFHRNGKPSAKEIYKNGALVDKQYFDEQGTLMDTVNRDRSAAFPGGSKAWQKYLGKKLYFPPKYKIVNGDKAIVVIDAIIDEEGNVTDVTVSAPFHKAFDEIAVAVVKRSPKWEPAIQHNRHVHYKIRQPVIFGQE